MEEKKHIKAVFEARGVRNYPEKKRKKTSDTQNSNNNTNNGGNENGRNTSGST